MSLSIIPQFFLGSNPFFDAYMESDFLGRVIFIGLITLSICSWTILLQKLWFTTHSKKNSAHFQQTFVMQKSSPLNFEIPANPSRHANNPFLEIYLVLKKQTLDILNKNRHYGQNKGNHAGVSYLSPTDIDFVESHIFNAISSQIKQLEKNLFILSTTVTLAPFLGLLGTVWGILTTFSQLQTHSGGSTHQMVLGGLSLALATTVMGLLGAIPALIGYNYLKNTVKDFQTEMECFSNEVLASVEMQYRQVDLK